MSQSPIKLNANQKIVNDDGSPTNVFLQYLLKISESVVIVGTGTPEGAVQAPQYSVYVDEAVPLTPVTYRKMLPEVGGDRSKGWAVV